MSKLVKMRTRQEWRILALSLIVPVLMLSFYALRYGRVPARNELVEALAGVAALCLMFQAWKVHKESLTKGVLFGTASTLFLLASNYYPDEDRLLVFMVMAAPLSLEGLKRWFFKKHEKEQLIIRACVTWLVIAVLSCALWAFLTWNDMDEIFPALFAQLIETVAWSLLQLREYADNAEKAKKLWRAWLLCLLFCYWILGERTLSGMFFNTRWYSLYWFSLPLIYAWLLRFLKKQKLSRRIEGLVYFAFCLIVFWNNMSGWHYGPSGEIFFLLMPLIVYAGEKRREEKSVSAYVLPLLYTLVCGVMTFLGSERLRTVIYNLDGPAIDIPNAPRVDWLRYRLGGLKSFFIGNIYYYEGQPGFQDFEHAVDYNALEEPVYPYFWLYFLVLVLVVAAVSILLLRMRWSDAALNRSKNYLAISFFLRVAIIIPGVLFMYGVSGVAFPFEPYRMMDLLILWLLFEKHKSVEALRDELGEV